MDGAGKFLTLICTWFPLLIALIQSLKTTSIGDIEFCHSHSLAIVSDAVSGVLVIFGA